MKNGTKKTLYAAVGMMAAGVTAGAFYMAYSGGGDELYGYLNTFFESFAEDKKYFEIFKNSMIGNIKLCLFIIVCAFFRPGAVCTLACCLFKGFASGFTTAAFVKFYGIEGLLVPLSSLFASLLYIPALLFFCAYSAVFSVSGGKRDKNAVGRFLLFSVVCFTVFCIASFFDGYVTTSFIKLLKPFICKIG